jgi:hypothetical protein
LQEFVLLLGRLPGMIYPFCFVGEHPRFSPLLRMNFEDFQNRYGPVKDLNVPIGTMLGQHKPNRICHKPFESDTGSLQSDADFMEDSHCHGLFTDRYGCGTLQRIKNQCQYASIMIRQA